MCVLQEGGFPRNTQDLTANRQSKGRIILLSWDKQLESKRSREAAKEFNPGVVSRAVAHKRRREQNGLWEGDSHKRPNPAWGGRKKPRPQSKSTK